MARASGLERAPTGIAGFDRMTGGGLPRARACVVTGSAGSGKTVFALQSLVNAARSQREPGIFIAFEETVAHVMRNARSFGWNLPALQRQRLLMLDARLPVEAVQAGSFDLSGLLASLDVEVRRLRARRIVFDAIDRLLDLLPDPGLRTREVMRIQQWLDRHRLTALFTVKADPLDPGRTSPASHMAYLADCVIDLQRVQINDVVTRLLLVSKYRGAEHAENAVPYLIGAEGIDIDPLPVYTGGYKVYRERISTGIDRLDALLAGGLYRGSALLFSGAPGTAKTTLAGKLAEAACRRRERVLYVCFDESGAEIVRNLASVGLRLAAHERAGRLRMWGMISRARSAESILADIVRQVRVFAPRLLVLDPLSALLKGGDPERMQDVCYRLVQHCKSRGITLCATSLVDKSRPEIESTEIHVSTLADTWIHLSYLIRAGERNRALTVIKSRGTGHSNQVRELLLSDKGIRLADVSVLEGEMLMGTQRQQSESRAAREDRREAAARDLERRSRLRELEELSAHVREQQARLRHLRDELRLRTEADQREISALREQRAETSRRRRADPAGAVGRAR